MAYRKVTVHAKTSDEKLILPFTNDRAAERFTFIAREKGFRAEMDTTRYTTFSNTEKAVENLKVWSR